jgi:hypothetical protein
MGRYVIRLLACGLTLAASSSSAIDIVVVGSWAVSIDSGDLRGGPGTDLIAVYESTPEEVTVTISNTTGNEDNWRVDVRRTDTKWHEDFALYVKRTGSGTGGGSITGGTEYQEVTTSDSAFFAGSGDRTDIPLQLKLEGVSVHVPPDSYSTAVTYTVVDTL